MTLKLEKSSLYDTHEVFNQPPPLVDYNLFCCDQVLAEAVERGGGNWGQGELREFGETLGRADFLALGFVANRFPPELRSHDRFGHRIDQVDFHPAYHTLMRTGLEAGISGAPWARPGVGAQVVRAAKHFMLTQVEASVECPMTMTYASVPALRHQPDLAAHWEPLILSQKYDPRFLPSHQKDGVTIGMAMTEKQGGSDVRANTTQAECQGDHFLLTGHKWFCSAPMCDAFLTLAHSPGGLTCFLVPRFRPDGSQNRFFLQRLKDKLGNKANASAEIEYDRTFAHQVGEEGRGVPTIIEMVNHTRLDCVIGSAGIMRAALVQALHHAYHRQAFGALLIDQPLMRNVLADLALESGASTTLALWLASGYDRAQEDRAAQTLIRIATAVSKYWVCKRTPPMVYEALECLGGAGYVEESVLPRLYREAPLCSIWEGSGNVMCLDVLRAASKEPETIPALLTEIGEARGHDPRFDSYLKELKKDLSDAGDLPLRARHLVERCALALQASLLLRNAPNPVSEAFVLGRLTRQGQYGTLPREVDFKTLLERAYVSSAAE